MNVKMFASILMTCVITIGGVFIAIGAAEMKTSDSDAEALAVESNLKITTEGANVVVAFSNNDTFSYDYNSSKFTVTKSVNGSITEIKVTKKSGVSINWSDNVTVYIPNSPYTSVIGVANGGGLNMPAVNSDISVTNSSGSVTVNLPSGFTKNIEYTGTSCSGSINMNGNTNFAINAKLSGCAVSVPGGWPAYGGASTYSYNSGSGKALINFDLKKSSFSFSK